MGQFRARLLCIYHHHNYFSRRQQGAHRVSSPSAREEAWQRVHGRNRGLEFRTAHVRVLRHDRIVKIAPGGCIGFGVAGLVMNRFGYLSDPLFLAASLCYASNRWLLKPWLDSPFLHGHFNDLLLIPAALPVMLWVQRLIGLRKHDLAPSCSEMGMHLLVWSVICEFVGPFMLHHGIADLWDVAAYTGGGMAALLWWHRPGLRVQIGR